MANCLAVSMASHLSFSCASGTSALRLDLPVVRERNNMNFVRFVLHRSEVRKHIVFGWIDGVGKFPPIDRVFSIAAHDLDHLRQASWRREDETCHPFGLREIQAISDQVELSAGLTQTDIDFVSTGPYSLIWATSLRRDRRR